MDGLKSEGGEFAGGVGFGDILVVGAFPDAVGKGFGFEATTFASGIQGGIVGV